MPAKIELFRHTCVSARQSPPKKQKAPLSRGPQFQSESLLQIKLDRLLDRMIVTRQHRSRCESTMMTRRIPTFTERRNILRLDQPVLHTRSEHPGLAPPPHFLPTRILHHEIVRLAARETQLHHLRSIVANIERELDNLTSIHRELRAQRNLRMLFRHRCRKCRLVSHIATRERNSGSCTQQRNYQPICHHNFATSARDTGNITNVSRKAGVNLSTTRRSCNSEVTRKY